MATGAASGSDRTVSIGRVFSRGFGTIISNPIATIGISFLFGTLPSLLAAIAMETLQVDDPGAIGAVGMIAAGLGSIVVGIILFAITQGALVRATVAHSQGRVAGFGESAMRGLSMALPLFLAAILSALGIGLGMLLLVVPGVMLFCMWAVSAPALVEERLGPIQALGRSRYLTRGARWKVFGLTLVILICYWLFLALLGLLGFAIYGLDPEADASLMSMSVPYLVATVLVQTVSSAVWGVVLASLYVELREWKDGPAADALAEVFG